MKRIIPLIAVAVAMVIPSIMAAAEPSEEYNGYDNSTKTVLIEWVETEINNGNILFLTPEDEAEFLALIGTVYIQRDGKDWDGIVVTAAALKAKSATIKEEADQELVGSLCGSLGFVYSYPKNLMAIKAADVASIKAALAKGIGGQALAISIHCAGCDYIYFPDGSFMHLAACTTVNKVSYQNAAY